MSDNDNPGVFLNGKAQIVEMLKVMNGKERTTLLNNLRIKNPQLADELAERSITLEVIRDLSLPDMTSLFENILPQIMGLALRDMEESLQRKVLSMAPRDYAEKAFEIMITPLSGDIATKVTKAQNKVLTVLSSIARKKRRLLS